VNSQNRRIATTTTPTTPRIIGMLLDSVGVVVGSVDWGSEGGGCDSDIERSGSVCGGRA
jgi:hypothetical protein